ncbi:hypothetical protein [Streptomyces sp. NPDC053720]|uniref:hypothetical protein n=1 Tax=Streptomyces sp. NPDC053720 TaxID=3154855 RepID=UPI00341D9DA3
MIRLERTDLPADTAAGLKTYTHQIELTAENGRKAKAAELWAHTTVRRRVRDGLLLSTWPRSMRLTMSSSSSSVR